MAYEQSSPIPIVQGGTGKQSFTAYSVVTGGTTSTGALQNVSGVGTSGQVLTSNGASALPSWQAAGGGSGITTLAGDSGSATGSTVTLTGGTSGAVFTGSGSTMTESFNFLALPNTTSTNGQITMGGTRFLSDFGGNTVVGLGASNFTNSTNLNVAIGTNVMPSVTSGDGNTGVGNSALNALTSAPGNAAVGYLSLNNLSTGTGHNTAIGQQALQQITTGTANSAMGYQSGNLYTSSESSNIMINNQGTVGDNNTLRIGAGTGTGSRQLNAAFISGIQTITVTGTAVLVSSSDQLGIAVSSARYKENIEDMGSVSSNILKLRPVTFNYIVGDDHSPQTGLIAEEVSDIMPSLVVYDKENLPQTIKYHDLPVLLLSELQKALKRIEALELLIKE